MIGPSVDESLLDRMVRAVERVRERLLRATEALESARIPYAVIDDHAVAAHVASVDPAAVRNTQDADILLRRTDLDAATRAMESAGFTHRHLAGIDVFLDGPNARARDAVHVVLAGEKVWPEYAQPAPDVNDSLETEQFRLLSLDALVRMKLTSFRLKDQVHLQDMLDVELIDASWLPKLPPELALRLKQIIEIPRD